MLPHGIIGGEEGICEGPFLFLAIRLQSSKGIVKELTLRRKMRERRRVRVVVLLLENEVPL
jgi:hypothetical protein